MEKQIEVNVISKNSLECYTKTIEWSSIKELATEIEILNSKSDDLFGNQCYWDWDEDECTETENKIINGQI